MQTQEQGRITAAIFDFDGTLADSMYIWDAAPRALILNHGGRPPKDILGAIGPMVLDEALAWIRDNFIPGGDVAELKAELDALTREEYERKVTPKPGALEALKRFKARGLNMCVLSATDSALVSAALKRFGALEAFDFVAFSDDYGGKARPECFLRAAQRLGSAPQETAVFEDALHAGHSAKRAGFYLAGIYDKSGEKDWPELKRIADWSGRDISKWPRA